MASTKEEQYQRLRKLFNGSIRGKNIDAVLRALANPAVYLVNNLQAVYDNFFISSAVDRYLDQRLADYGLIRPPQVGLADDVFRGIGLSLINRKQVRDLVTSILTTMFGDELTQATSRSATFEPFNLDDGDKLDISFDGSQKVSVTFLSSQFQNISSATAQEVADAITKSLRSQGKTGRAFAKNDGMGPYVIIISDTAGPQSSVAVLGGRAQNVLVFDKPRPTTGGAATQWTISVSPGGFLRYTWTSGPNPSVGKTRIGDYANIFGSSFSAENQGTYTITDVKGGTVGNAYFEVSNPLGVSEVVVQGADGILFFQPFVNLLTTKPRYAAIFQEESRLLEVFIPATTKVVRRFRQGAAHIHEPTLTTETYSPGTNLIQDVLVPDPVAINDGDYWLINSSGDSNLYYVYYDTTGGNLVDPMIVGRTGLRVDISLAVDATEVAALTANQVNSTLDFLIKSPTSPFLRINNSEVGTAALAVNGNVLGLTVTQFQAGSDEIETSVTVPNPDELLPDQEGPYIYDLTQPFVLSDIGTTASTSINPDSSRVIQVADASNFPDDQGFIILSYGTERQEGPIPYLARPSANTLLISPSYRFVNDHNPGADVRLIAQNGPVSVDQTGQDFPAYITDVVAGREYAESIINEITATGINVVITILYPGSQGLGKWGTEFDEKVSIWGGDNDV